MLNPPGFALRGGLLVVALLIPAAARGAEGGKQAQVTVETVPVGATVSVDGKPFGNAPLEVPLAPGIHEVRVTAEGYDIATRRVTTEAGVAQTLSVMLEASAIEYYTREGNLTFWGGLGLGAAMATAGHLGAANSADAIRDGDLDAIGANRGYSALALGGYFVAAVGTALGAYLWQQPRRKEVEMVCYEEKQTGRRLPQRICIPRDEELGE